MNKIQKQLFVSDSLQGSWQPEHVLYCRRQSAAVYIRSPSLHTVQVNLDSAGPINSLSELDAALSLVHMAGGIYDSRNLNRYNSKWPEVKIFFFLDIFIQNVLELFLAKKKKLC